MANITLKSNNYPSASFEIPFFAEYLSSGAVSSDKTAQLLFVVPDELDGAKIVSAFGGFGENGADGTDAMSTEFDVLKNGSTVFSTKPALTKAAGTGAKNTLAAGTGITVGVLDADEVTLAAGDILTATINITITTPDTAYSDGFVVVGIKPQQEDIP